MSPAELGQPTDTFAMARRGRDQLAATGGAVLNDLAARHGIPLLRELLELVRCELRSATFNADFALRDPDDSPAPEPQVWAEAYRPDIAGRAALDERLNVAGDLLSALLGWYALAEGSPVDLAVDLWAANWLFDTHDDDHDEITWLYGDGRFVDYVTAGVDQRRQMTATWADHEAETTFVYLMLDCAGVLARTFFDGAIIAVDDLLACLGGGAVSAED